ncbi:unnamed protein product [Peronospora belbahrii]|uniref:Thiamine pyrophosphokinase n=1 Tax=Peronospora belbahrii TaxID=622444 RepID=A0AAU9KX23_9STRA|nr:unnamed protein product [Peronospora belbahrii]CAH0519500.1 unnamed protein product [Peronospora belbahrii]
MTLHYPKLPVQEHSNAFWSDPNDMPHLAVLLLNATYDSWHVPTSGMGSHSAELFWNMWSHARLTVCADGGANRLFDRSVNIKAQELVKLHYIKGDLDSLRDDVREFFIAKGTTVLKDPDQNTNDLDKCLQLVFQLQEEMYKHQDTYSRFTVMIFGSMGGRFDQEMQNVNALFRWRDKFQQMVLMSEKTTVRLLMPDIRHVITPNFAFETRTCGLIPIAGTCKETATSGLKWNLSPGMETGFGGLISSSNYVEDLSNQVEVVTSHPLLWTTELKKK